MQWQLTKDNDTITVNYISDAVVFHRNGYNLTAVIFQIAGIKITDRKELEQYEREIIQSYF